MSTAECGIGTYMAPHHFDMNTSRRGQGMCYSHSLARLDGIDPFSSTTQFTSVPIPCPTSTSIRSPPFMNFLGFLTNPTPAGVPVRIIVLGIREYLEG